MSVDGEVDVDDEVSVIVVSAGGGAMVSVAVSVRGRGSRGAGEVRCVGIDGVVLPIVSVTTGAFVRADTRGRDGAIPGAPVGYVVGIEDAIEPPAVSLPRGAGLFGSVMFVVVSTFVFVIGGVVSPGALIVDVTPLAEPSCTVWYCC